MGDVKSWIVTYTKHIKQKRKVYQDGVLEIHGSTNKVMLFDDSGKLLECRLMKEEVIGSGETLAFDSYLVDIGDPKGSHEHFTNLNTQERKPNGTNRIFHGQKARNILTFSEKRTDVGNTGAPQDCPNVTKNITREYKKSELEFNAPKSHQNTTKTTVTEWHALYTTQTTKKAKKYHDGFLRLSICGSQGRQVMLYDESRKLLDTRFLKKDEVIGPGETLAFDAHLVDVGDPEGNHSPLKDLNFKGEDTKVIEKTRTAHEQKARYCSSVENGNKELKNLGSLQSHANPAQTSVKEWNALYTTQITQKAKKFHDGILQLTFCNPRGKQVILLDEGGTKLSNKYIKFSEDVITGSVLEVTNYLVEIGEPRQLQGGKSQENASSREGISSNSSNYIANNLGVSRSTRLPDGKSQKNASSGEGVRSNSSNYIANNLGVSRSTRLRDGKSQKNASSGEGVRSNSSSYIDDNLGSSRSTQLRDAKQIMSILKKPMAQESLVHARNVPVEQSHSSHPSYLVQSGAQDQPPAGCSHGSKFFERNESDDHEYDPKNLNGARTASFNTCRSGSLESKEAQDDLVVDITNLMDHNHRISTFDCSLRAAAPNISPKPDLGYTDKRMVKTAQSIAEPQASDVIVLNLPEDTLPSEFSGPRSQVPKDINVTSNQHLDSIRTGTQWGKKTSLMGLSNSLTGSASFFSTDDERESSEVQNIPKQIMDIGDADMGNPILIPKILDARRAGKLLKFQWKPLESKPKPVVHNRTEPNQMKMIYV